MPQCIVSRPARGDIRGILADRDRAAAGRFAELLGVALEALEQDTIRSVLPPLGRFVSLPLHRLQGRIPRERRGPKARHMLVLARLPSGDWYVVMASLDNRLPANILRTAERRFEREQP